MARLADANAYRDDTPLPRSIWSRDDALIEIESRTGLQTRVATQAPKASEERHVGAMHAASGSPSRPTRRPSLRRGVLVAAAAFVAVFVVGAVTSALDLGAPGDAVGANDALALVDDYFSAFEVGDLGSMPDALVPIDPARFVRVCEDPCTYFDTWSFDYHQRYSAYKIAQGTTLLDRTCEVTGSSNAEVAVTCEYREQEYVASVVGGPPSPTVATITVTREGIGAIELAYGGEAPADAAEDQFKSWMSRLHPESWGSVGKSTWISVDDAMEKGSLTARYGEEWAAYLEDNGCTYLDNC